MARIPTRSMQRRIPRVTDSQPKTEVNLREWIHWIMWWLLAWGALISTGAYLYGGKYALIKAVVISVCAAVFVFFWWLMLTARERRMNRSAAKQEGSP
jgi:hypothetical protein